MSLRILYLAILVVGVSALLTIDRQLTARHTEDLQAQREMAVRHATLRARSWLDEHARLAQSLSLLVKHSAIAPARLLDQEAGALTRGDRHVQWIAITDADLQIEAAWAPRRRAEVPPFIHRQGATADALEALDEEHVGIGLEFGPAGMAFLATASPVPDGTGRLVIVRHAYRDLTTALQLFRTRNIYTRITREDGRHVAGAEAEGDPAEAATRSVSAGGLHLWTEAGLRDDSHTALGFQRFLIWTFGVFALVGFALAFAVLTLKSREVEEKSKVQSTQSHKLREFNQKLQEVNKELDDFTYVVSHDLKEPLRGIEAFSAILAEEYGDKLDEEAKEYMDTLRSSSQRMRLLIDDLLNLSRIARRHYEVTRVDFGELVKEVCQDLDYAIRSKNARIVVGNDLPTLECERVRMAEVFQNLISNAIKYCDKDQPRVDIGCKEKPEAYVFYVKDNGIGIEKKYHAKIFQIFQRLHRQEEYEGTGAGLTVCQRIVEKHGGRIWLESEPGAGTVFFFSLPKEQQAWSEA